VVLHGTVLQHSVAIVLIGVRVSLIIAVVLGLVQLRHL
jgi:hypothetical protein